MDIKPITLEYFFEVSGHSLYASCEHKDGTRELRFCFDDNEVAKKNIPDGDLLTDDDCICDIVDEYSHSHTGMFADLFRNHTDKVKLVSKVLEVKLEYFAIEILANITIKKPHYDVVLSSNGGRDTIQGSFEANDFSDVLEKLRIFSGALGGVSGELTDHINEISNDKVESVINWK